MLSDVHHVSPGFHGSVGSPDPSCWDSCFGKHSSATQCTLSVKSTIEMGHRKVSSPEPDGRLLWKHECVEGMSGSSLLVPIVLV